MGLTREGNFRNFQKGTLIIYPHLVLPGTRLCWEFNSYMWHFVRNRGEGYPAGLGIQDVGRGWEPCIAHWCNLRLFVVWLCTLGLKRQTAAPSVI